MPSLRVRSLVFGLPGSCWIGGWQASGVWFPLWVVVGLLSLSFGLLLARREGLLTWVLPEFVVFLGTFLFIGVLQEWGVSFWWEGLSASVLAAVVLYVLVYSVFYFLVVRSPDGAKA